MNKFLALFLLLPNLAFAQISQQTLTNTIDNNITTNNQQFITGQVLQNVLNSMTSAIFQSQGLNGLTVTNTPTIGEALIATGTSTASWQSIGGITSVSNLDGSLNISPTTGNVVASLNTAHSNIWTGSNTFTGLNGTIGSTTGIITIPSNNPINGVWFAGQSSGVTWCPGANFGCPNPTGGSQFLAQGVIITTTAGVANVQETGLQLIMNNNTGVSGLWIGSTSYAINTYVTNGANMYIETTPTCTSASSGGPTGTGTGIVDNTCTWNYAGPQYARAKQTLGVNIVTNANGGNSWAFATDNLLNSGWHGQFATVQENDMVNNSGVDATVGSGTTIYNTYIGGTVGSNIITSHLYISPNPNGTNYGAQIGVWLNGAFAARDQGFRNSSNSAIGWYDDATHSTATATYFGTAPIGLQFTGTFSNAAISLSSGQKVCLNAISNCIRWDGVGISLTDLLDLSGSNGGILLASRTGSGTNFTFYNQNGTNLKFFNGSSDVFTVTTAGALTMASGITATAYTVGATAGASCTITGATAHLTVVNGIVTVCN